MHVSRNNYWIAASLILRRRFRMRFHLREPFFKVGTDHFFPVHDQTKRFFDKTPRAAHRPGDVGSVPFRLEIEFGGAGGNEGLEEFQLDADSSGLRLSTTVILPSPTSSFPAQDEIAPLPAGAPSKVSFMAGSSFAHGDQFFQL
jgi:hypothetical protein